jgi:hypothetical protein
MVNEVANKERTSSEIDSAIREDASLLGIFRPRAIPWYVKEYAQFERVTTY